MVVKYFRRFDISGNYESIPKRTDLWKWPVVPNWTVLSRTRWSFESKWRATQNDHQNLKVVTDINRLQHPSPTPMSPTLKAHNLSTTPWKSFTVNWNIEVFPNMDFWKLKTIYPWWWCHPYDNLFVEYWIILIEFQVGMRNSNS